MTPRRIVLSALGSHGDLHPALVVAQALQARGHSAVVATDLQYQGKVEAAGVGFARMRPGVEDFGSDPEVFARINRQRSGTEFILRKLVMPWIEQSAEDLLDASKGADLLVAHPLAYATPAVAERLGIPWISTALQPIVFLSAYDPSVLPQAPWLEALRWAGPVPFRAVKAMGKVITRPWVKPVLDLRRSWGLSQGEHPLFGGQFSAPLTLALFSRVLAEPQPDWPANTLVTGFPFHDHTGSFEGEGPLERFLAAGPPPILFTLGTTAVRDPGRFYEESLAAVRSLGERAIFLVGHEPAHDPLGALPDSVLALGYVPFDRLMPRVKAIVHQGGVGTTGQALRSGRPQLVVPWANDQPDNAARVARRGVGLALGRDRYAAGTVARALRRLLTSASIRTNAEQDGAIVRAERGAERAAEAIESLLASP